jgi:ABC-type multidrug transport system fused ATPase/permease subunit
MSAFASSPLQVIKKFLKTRRGLFSQTFMLDLAANLCWLAISLIAAQTYTTLFDMQSARGAFLQDLKWITADGFWDWILLLLFFILLKAGLDAGRFYFRGKLGEAFVYFLRLRLFDHQLKMDIRQYEERGAGRFLLRFSGDLSSLQGFLTRGILRFFSDLTVVLLGLGFMIWLDRTIGLGVLACLFFLGIFIGIINQKIGKVEEKRRNKKSGLLAFVNERLINIRSVKALNRYYTEWSRFRKRSKRLFILGKSYFGWRALLQALVPFMVYGILLLVLVLVAWKKQAGEDIDSGRLFALVIILLSWRSVLMRLFRVGLVWKKGMISLRKYHKLLTYPIDKKIDQRAGKIPVGPLVAEELNVYKGQEKLISKLSFSVDSGESCLLLVGSNSSKTLLTHTLSGLYDGFKGQLTIAGTSIQECHPKSWRRRISFLSPSYPLFGRRVIDVIAYSRRKKDRASAKHLFREWQQLFPDLRQLTLDQRFVAGATRFTEQHLTLLQWMRALLSNKAILVADEPFRGLHRIDIHALLDWLQQNYPDLAMLMLSQEEALTTLPYFSARQIIQISEKKKKNTVTFANNSNTIKIKNFDQWKKE